MHIQQFCGEREDETLLDLIPFLIKLAGAVDVRNVGHRYREYMFNKRRKELTDIRKFNEEKVADRDEIASESQTKPLISNSLSQQEPINLLKETELCKK